MADNDKQQCPTYRSSRVKDLQHALWPIHLHLFPIRVFNGGVILLHKDALHKLNCEGWFTNTSRPQHYNLVFAHPRHWNKHNKVSYAGRKRVVTYNCFVLFLRVKVYMFQVKSGYFLCRWFCNRQTMYASLSAPRQDSTIPTTVFTCLLHHCPRYYQHNSLYPGWWQGAERPLGVAIFITCISYSMSEIMITGLRYLINIFFLRISSTVHSLYLYLSHIYMQV